MHDRSTESDEVGSAQGEGSHLQRAAHERDVPAISKLGFRDHIAAFGLKPDKRLGQHWLTSEKVIGQIILTADGLSSVLEIGPGPGVLTGPLSEKCSVVALEVDGSMIPAARGWAPSAEVRLADALSVDWKEVLDGLAEPRGIVSNMPYNITGPLLERVCRVQGLIDRAVLMMQREVGEKMVALPGDRTRGSLSVVLQHLFHVQKVCVVPPGAFWPPPKVESIVLKLTPRLVADEHLFRVVRLGFASPRKTLVNNLSCLGKDHVAETLASLGLLATIRPHELQEQEWHELAKRLPGDQS